jgi:hypothetical protein
MAVAVDEESAGLFDPHQVVDRQLFFVLDDRTSLGNRALD